jgi:hypothetical protein
MQQEIMISVLNDIEAAVNFKFTYFLNRGMVFWPQLKNIDAILLEGIHETFPNSATQQQLHWIRQNLILRLKLLSAITPNTPIFGLTYQKCQFDQIDLTDQKDKIQTDITKSESSDILVLSEERLRVTNELSKYLTGTILGVPSLNKWPEALQC